MKVRPLLFSAPMVRALLAGRKTQTRRVVKLQRLAGNHFVGGTAGVEFDGFRIPCEGGLAPARFSAEAVGGGAYISEEIRCPHGQPGDRIWIRETFFAYGRWVTRYSEKKARDEWHFIDMTIECDRAYQYDADAPNVPLAAGRGGALPGWYKRPAIFMPRAACRILLEIVSLRVERLQDISDADIAAEGIECSITEGRFSCGGKYIMPWRDKWRALWESTGGEWDANPWCWAITFKRVTP